MNVSLNAWETDRLLDQADDLTLIRKTIQLFLGKNLLIINTDNKYTTGTRD